MRILSFPARLAVLMALMAATIGIAPVPASASAAELTAPAVGACYFGPVDGGAQTNYVITWAPVTGIDAEAPGTSGGYVISRQVDGAGTWWWRNRAEPGTSAWFDNDPGAAGTTPSQYRIKTKDATGTFSTDVICQPLAAVDTATIDSINQASGASDVMISWEPVPGVTGYEVLRAEGNNAPTAVAANVTGTIWTDTGVADGHYTWSVVALATAEDNAAIAHTWKSAPSSTNLTVVDANRPTASGAPHLTGTPEATGASFSWKASTDVIGVVGYHLYFDDDGVGPIPNPEHLAATSVTTSGTITGLTPNTTYSVYTRAIDAAGNVSWRSGFTTFTTDPGEVGQSGEQYATKEIDGRWELIHAADRDQATPAVQRWQSIGVRYDNVGGLDAIDAEVIGDIEQQGFNAIRLPLHWSDVEPSQGVYDQHLLTDVDELIARADAAGLGVILDPLHLGGGAAQKFWIPQWAWNQTWTGSQAAATDPDDSTEVLMWDDPAVPDDDDLGLAYLKYLLDRYKDEPAVIAFELVNEPHPIAGNAWGTTSDIADLQAQWVSELRSIDADKPLIVTGYFGGFLADGTKFTDAFTTNGIPNWDNVVFTAHTYYSGIGISGDNDSDDDGYGDTTSGPSFRMGNKTGTRVEGYASRGCYGVAGFQGGPASSPFSCPTPSEATRAVAVANLARGITAQDQVAQGANMPLFIGEFGSHRPRHVSTGSYTGWAGWGYADMMLCDQIKALRSVSGTNHVSYSVWDLTTGGFGTYDLATKSWNELGAQFADSACTG